MAKERFLIRRKLKPESVAEYIQYHQNVPPALMEIYRECGVTDLSCFLCENDLVVYLEVESEKYALSKERLAQNAVDAEWQALMRTLNLPGFETLNYQEVFRM